MKIIALLPFKNEEWVLKEYITSIKKITDHIIAYDDNSIDGGRKLLEDAGAYILTENYKEKSGWAEFSIRERLLAEGRAQGGTHFICLDADEIFSHAFYTNAKKHLERLLPGQSLWMDWVNIYQNIHTERLDGVYKKINKSFIFCDEPSLTFSYAFLGVSRTPGDPLNRVVLKREEGSVVHFQFLNTKRSGMKRVWYMCSELIRGDRSALRINTTYDIQKEQKNIATRHLDDTMFEIPSQSIIEYDKGTDWRFAEIMKWFDEYGVSFFEQLDIWGDDFFRDEFLRREKKSPKPKVLPVWVMKLNDIKNSIIVGLKVLYSTK